MKPGIKSTEFYITIGVQLVGVLATLGVFTPDQAGAATRAVEQIAGIVAMLGAAFGYSISRGMAKKGPDNSAGYSTLSALVAIFAATALILALSGCSYFDRIYTPAPAGKGVCDRPGAESSIICRVCHDMGIEPEQLDGLLLDASMVAIIADKDIDREKVLGFIDRIELYLEISDLTHRMLIRFIEDEAQAEALSILLSRKLKNFDIPDVIGSFDRKLIRLHLSNQRDRLGGKERP